MKRLALALSLAAWLLSAGAAPAAETNAAAGAPFYFVQITDSHFGSGGNDARMRQVVDAINALPMPVAFVVHTGDVTADNILSAPVMATATATLARLKAPLHVLPGNHDILATNVPPTLAAYTNAFGPICSRFEHAGVVCLLLDTEPLRKRIRIEGYDPLAWLDSSLKEAGGQPVLVFHHTPPVDDFYGNTMHRGWKPEVRAKWENLLNAANVKAVVTGHFHRDELHWLGRVPLYVSSSIADYWGRQGSFRIYEYAHGKLSYRTRYLE
jgi:3',5'-cyclic AMP phosphodiesterase CpdA